MTAVRGPIPANTERFVCTGQTPTLCGPPARDPALSAYHFPALDALERGLIARDKSFGTRFAASAAQATEFRRDGIEITPDIFQDNPAVWALTEAEASLRHEQAVHDGMERIADLRTRPPADARDRLCAELAQAYGHLFAMDEHGNRPEMTCHSRHPAAALSPDAPSALESTILPRPNAADIALARMLRSGTIYSWAIQEQLLSAAIELRAREQTVPLYRSDIAQHVRPGDGLPYEDLMAWLQIHRVPYQQPDVVEPTERQKAAIAARLDSDVENQVGMIPSVDIPDGWLAANGVTREEYMRLTRAHANERLQKHTERRSPLARSVLWAASVQPLPGPAELSSLLLYGMPAHLTDPFDAARVLRVFGLSSREARVAHSNEMERVERITRPGTFTVISGRRRLHRVRVPSRGKKALSLDHEFI